jgi:hypothetical protein
VTVISGADYFYGMRRELADDVPPRPGGTGREAEDPAGVTSTRTPATRV